MFVSKQELDTAIGQFKTQEQQRLYNGMRKIFTPLEAPKPGDWLHGSKQAHQSFANYRLPFYNPVTPERKTIYLLEFDEFDKKFIEELCKFCRIFYTTFDVKYLPPVEFQKQLGGIRKREGYYRNQYLAQDILAYMQKRVPNDAYCVMGITLQDIYPAESWLFAYGWAKYKARVGIFSFLRFDQLYSRKKTDKINWEVILYPSMRTMAHQIGHMFGVTHCVYYRCLMNGFNGIQENYSKPFEFCPVCFRKISTNIRFDLILRYKQLLDYCKDSNINLLKNDIEVYERLLQNSEKFPFKLLPINAQKQIIGNQSKANSQQIIKKDAPIVKTSFRLSIKKSKVEIEKPPSRPKAASTKNPIKNQSLFKKKKSHQSLKAKYQVYIQICQND